MVKATGAKPLGLLANQEGAAMLDISMEHGTTIT